MSKIWIFASVWNRFIEFFQRFPDYPWLAFISEVFRIVRNIQVPGAIKKPFRYRTHRLVKAGMIRAGMNVYTTMAFLNEHSPTPSQTRKPMTKPRSVSLPALKSSLAILVAFNDCQCVHSVRRNMLGPPIFCTTNLRRQKRNVEN